MAEKRVAKVEVHVGTLLHAPRPVDVQPKDLSLLVVGYFYEGSRNEGEFRKEVTQLLTVEEREMLAGFMDALLHRVEDLSL